MKIIMNTSNISLSLLALFALAPEQVNSLGDRFSANATPSSSQIMFTSSCGSELSDLCSYHISNTFTLEELYEARICLWTNREDLSETCSHYLTQAAPSIIEPCLNDIQSFCSGVKPGYGQVHMCLASRPEDVSVRCASALFKDNIGGTVQNPSPLNIEDSRDISETKESTSLRYKSIEATAQLLQIYANFVESFYSTMRSISGTIMADEDDNIFLSKKDFYDDVYVGGPMVASTDDDDQMPGFSREDDAGPTYSLDDDAYDEPINGVYEGYTPFLARTPIMFSVFGFKIPFITSSPTSEFLSSTPAASDDEPCHKSSDAIESEPSVSSQSGSSERVGNSMLRRQTVPN